MKCSRCEKEFLFGFLAARRCDSPSFTECRKNSFPVHNSGGVLYSSEAVSDAESRISGISTKFSTM